MQRLTHSFVTYTPLSFSQCQSSIDSLKGHSIQIQKPLFLILHSFQTGSYLLSSFLSFCLSASRQCVKRQRAGGHTQHHVDQIRGQPACHNPRPPLFLSSHFPTHSSRPIPQFPPPSFSFPSSLTLTANYKTSSSPPLICKNTLFFLSIHKLKKKKKT